MNLLTIISTAIGILLCSCTCSGTIPSERNDLDELAALLPKVPAGLVKSYVDSDEIIDVDLTSLTIYLDNSRSKSVDRNTREIAKAKAALYRFYKNVEVVDGYFVCHVDKASDAKLSKRTFNLLYNSLKEMNKSLKKDYEKGVDVVITAPDERYLKSLLE